MKTVMSLALFGALLGAPTLVADMQESARTPAQQQIGREIVSDVQQQLRERGYATGPVDGIYGRNTRQAIIAFQEDQGLRRTGRIDRQTMAELGVGFGPQQAGIEDSEPLEREPASEGFFTSQPGQTDVLR